MKLSELITKATGLTSAGRAEDAIDLYRGWINSGELVPKAIARFNLAVLLTEKSFYKEAEKELRLSIEESPRFAQAFHNLGLNLERQSRFEEAIAAWLTAFNILKLSKKHEDVDLLTAALNQIGRVQESLKNYDEAEFALKKSLSYKKFQPDAIQHLIHIRQKKCAWDELEYAADIGVAAQKNYISPLAALAQSDSPVEQQLSALSFSLRKYPYGAIEPRAKANNRGKISQRRIRLGFVSGDLCTHAVGLLLVPFFQSLSKEKFATVAFDFSHEDNSTTRRQLKHSFDEFYSIKALSDEHAANLIRSQSIDFLFDMHGLSSGARPKIFASRPASSQIAWLGYMGTTNFPWIDYIIVDRVCFPLGLRSYFTETPLFVDGSFIPINLTEPPKPKKLFDGKGVLTLGCLNNVYKLNRNLFFVWLNVVLKNENVKLVLLDDNNSTTKKLKGLVKEYGIEEDRVEFFKRGSYSSYKKQLRQIDVYLDTYPYCAGSTARDVINSGTLLLTLQGETMVSRMGSSILVELGFTETISTSILDYKARLEELVSDVDTLNIFQRKFETCLQSLPKLLLNNVRSFESLFLSLERDYRDN